MLFAIRRGDARGSRYRDSAERPMYRARSDSRTARVDSPRPTRYGLAAGDPMNSAIEELGTRLARCRRRGEIAVLPLDSIRSRAEAEAVQDAAVAAYGGRRRGYKIGATNAGVQHLLGFREPFFGPLFAEDMLESGATFRMVPGLLGIECEFAFVLKRACPAEAVS